jgi:hypothetical protein
MWKQIAAGLATVLMLSTGSGTFSYASDSSTESQPGAVDRIGETVKKIGEKIGEGFKKTGKKIEEKHIPDKVEKKLKKAVDKTAEGFEKAERKMKQKLAD